MGNYLATALHALAHLRHSSAHAFMCSSSGNASQASAHWSQLFAQHSAIVAESGPLLAQTWEQAAQQVAQSLQCIRADRCSFLPSASRFAQWVAQRSHARWQSEQAFAHACSLESTFASAVRPGWARASTPTTARVSANAIIPIPNIRFFMVNLRCFNRYSTQVTEIAISRPAPVWGRLQYEISRRGPLKTSARRQLT